MEHTREEILKALHIIKNVCEESKDCEKCPFRYGFDDCCITMGRPDDWEMPNENTPWKAFEC